MGGEVCVSNSQRLLAAAETENDGRGAAQQLRLGACFVFMCFMCGVYQPANRTSTLILFFRDHKLALHDGIVPITTKVTTSSFPGYKKGFERRRIRATASRTNGQLMGEVRMNCFLACRERIESYTENTPRWNLIVIGDFSI